MYYTRNILPVGDLIFASFMIVMGIAYIFASFDMPPPALEPVGPAAFPRWISVMQIILAGVVIQRAVFGQHQPKRQSSYRKRHDLAIITLLLIIAYFGVLQLELLGFQWATVGFIFLLTAALFDWQISKLPVAAGISLILGIGLHYTFTEILYLDLP